MLCIEEKDQIIKTFTYSCSYQECQLKLICKTKATYLGDTLARYDLQHLLQLMLFNHNWTCGTLHTEILGRDTV